MSVFGICVFLWLADIVDGLSSILKAQIVVCIIAVFFGGFIYTHRSVYSNELISNVVIEYVSKIKKYVIASILCLALGILIPSKQAVYMIGGTIAGSEIISKVADSKEYKKLMELFNLALDKQIKELKESK